MRMRLPVAGMRTSKEEDAAGASAHSTGSDVGSMRRSCAPDRDHGCILAISSRSAATSACDPDGIRARDALPRGRAPAMHAAHEHEAR